MIESLFLMDASNFSSMGTDDVNILEKECVEGQSKYISFE